MVEAVDTLTIDECVEASARVHHLDFVRYCWQRADPFIEARQTPFQQITCSEIDQAIARYREGLSTYLCILMPAGSGKSDLTSRYLPPHFLGEFPDSEVIVTSYNDDKTNEFGGFGRRLVESPEYSCIYPDVKLDPSNHSVGCWGLAGRHGKAQYVSLASGSAGKRANLIVVDDFFGKREHAESEEMRNKAWQRITEDFMSRRAPVTVVVWVVTPWHVDDPIARMRKLMKESPAFPQFKFIKFPAESPDYASGYLFPERYGSEWYNDQKLLLGDYGYRATMMCDPKSPSGNMFRVDKIHLYDSLEEVPHQNLRFKRAWDLASSTKQTQKSSPDFTVGVRGAIHWEPTAVKNMKVPTLVVDDMVRGQWEAPQRQTIIRDVAMSEEHSPVGTEAFAAYKDAYTLLAEILKGIRKVSPLKMAGDKVAKATPLVPLFEAGNIWMKRAPWNEALFSELLDFPSGKHDDMVDALAMVYEMCKEQPRVSFESA